MFISHVFISDALYNVEEPTCAHKEIADLCAKDCK